MNLTVIGLGLIGGSLALDLRAKGLARSVVGVDVNLEHCRLALNRGIVDRIAPLKEALSGAELVVLAVPVDKIISLLPEVLDQISAETTVSDMGSTKKAICEIVAGHAKRAQYVAAHPMAGTEHSGPGAALRGLFANRSAVICEAEQSAASHLRRVDEMFEVLQMKTVYMAADEHDLHTAFISHLSHAISFVLANTVLNKENSVSTIFDLASGGFESTSRLAKSSSAMWLPIFEQNREHVLAALEAYMENLRIFQQSLLNKSFDETKALMENANGIRRVLQNIRQASRGTAP
ncbi:MAG: prephenate dehydrogenase [Bdellovibrionales bacterium]|nr:prephenate dehydrogenase [Bdellovibrionales bacterium]